MVSYVHESNLFEWFSSCFLFYNLCWYIFHFSRRLLLSIALCVYCIPFWSSYWNWKRILEEGMHYLGDIFCCFDNLILIVNLCLLFHLFKVSIQVGLFFVLKSSCLYFNLYIRNPTGSSFHQKKSNLWFSGRPCDRSGGNWICSVVIVVDLLKCLVVLCNALI